jgi:hypothetical protein
MGRLDTYRFRSLTCRRILLAAPKKADKMGILLAIILACVFAPVIITVTINF